MKHEKYLKLQTNTQKIQIPKNSKSYSKSVTKLKIPKNLSKYPKKKFNLKIYLKSKL